MKKPRRFRAPRTRRSIRFEALEPRLALTIIAPLPPVYPDAASHIHPTLTIILDGQQLTIPAGVGISPSGQAAPHTHDFTGTLHIGEGPIAGIDSSGSPPRNVKLKDFFDVWASSTLTAAPAHNTSAVFDTDPNDGTSLPRLMNQTLDTSHVLRMYVKETAESTPELEYSSDSQTNDILRPELYVPRDSDQIIISYDKATQSADSPSFEPIANQTVLGGAPTWLGINGFDPSGGPLSYNVTSTNPSLLQAVLSPSTNKSLVLNVASSTELSYGQMIFQLFDDLAPRTTNHIETLVNSAQLGANATFYRVAWYGTTPFVIQAGPSNITSSLGQFDDEYNPDLQFTSPGLLAMAKSTDDTNDNQIFVNAVPTRFLDFQHSIFGVLTEGEAVRQAIQNSRPSGDGAPPNPITISSAQIITDIQNTALELKAAPGASGSADVTLTVTDAQNHTYSQTFHVTVAPDPNNPAPFLNPIAPVTGIANQPIDVQLTATDAQNKDPVFFDATRPGFETVNYALNVDHATGLVTITPPTDFVGSFHVTVGVRGSQTRTTADQFDAQDILVQIGPQGPSVDLAAQSDSGDSNSDNITNAASLDFVISDVTVGATVRLLNGTSVLASGVAASSTITLTVTDPSSALGQGVSAITATEILNGEESPPGAPLNVTYDTTPPSFTSTAPTFAQVGLDLHYDAQTIEEGLGSGLTYSLTSNNVGATINPSTGVVTWTPTTSQVGVQSFAIVATDAAGNRSSQQLSFSVADLPNHPPIAVDDSALAFSDRNLTIEVLANDTAAPDLGESLSIVSVTAPGSGGTALIAEGHNIAYRQASGFTGIDTFTYTISDGRGGTATATVTVTVLSSSAEKPNVDLLLQLTTPEGAPLTSLAPGQEFVLHVLTNDHRANPHGVFAAYLDITWDSSLAEATGPIQFSNAYPNGRNGLISTPGMIDEGGAFAGITEFGGGVFEVFSVPMGASAAGSLVFTSDPADQVIFHDVLVYGRNEAVPTTSIYYGSASIMVASQPPLSPLDVNVDGQISPLDALLVINVINGQIMLGIHDGSLPNDPGSNRLDVSQDGLLTPIDALVIINWLNDPASSSADSAATAVAEGEAEPAPAISDQALLAADQVFLDLVTAPRGRSRR